MTDMIIAALIVAVIIAFVRIFAQRKAILRLEAKLDNLQQQLADVMAMVSNQNSVSNPSQPALPSEVTTSPSSEQPPLPFTQPIHVQPPSNQPTQPHQPTLSNPPNNDESAVNIVTSLWGSISKWFFGENLVVRVGALVLLVGVVLLLKLASQYIQVAMPVRMALVALGGFVMTAIGYRTTANRRNYGLTLQGVGFAVIYLTVFASFKRYELLPPTLTFVMLAILAGLTVMFSVWQNALPLAILAFGGAFLAPMLVSRPDGSVVMLFSYYLLLNIAVAVIAHYRTWKLLNALSLAVTFGLAYVWGFRQFTADSMGTSWLPVRWQLVGLLVAHMALYLFITVRYAQQIIHYNQTMATSANTLLSRPIWSVDSGLLFGTALLGFGLMASLLNDMPYHLAVASSGLSLTYLSLGFWLLKRHRQSLAGKVAAKQQFDNSFEVLIEASLALGCGFLALVIPLALSAKWLSIGWAVQGAALVWLGQRTQRHWAMYFGLVLQLLSAVLILNFSEIEQCWLYVLNTMGIPHQPALSDFSQTLPLSVVTIGLWLSAYVLRFGGIANAKIKNAPLKNRKRHKASAFKKFDFYPIEIIALLVAIVALLVCVSRWVADYGDFYVKTQTLSLSYALVTSLVLIVGQWLHEKKTWHSLHRLSRITLPMVMLTWLWVWGEWHYFATVYENPNDPITPIARTGFGKNTLLMFWCLAAAKLLGVWLLWRWSKQPVSNQRLSPNLRLQSAWLLVLIVMMTVMLSDYPFMYFIDTIAKELPNLLFIVPTLVSVLVLIGLQYLPPTTSAKIQPYLAWLDSKALLIKSSQVLVPVVVGWAFWVNWHLTGQLMGFYLPIINPLDMVLIASLLYMGYLAVNRALLASLLSSRYIKSLCIALGLTVFMTVSSMWVRSFGYFMLSQPLTWASGAWSVAGVQTGLTILWTVMAMALMFLANKKAIRLVWFAGMALLALVVAKLVLIDMSNTSAVLRVVSFIGAGLLMLIIGYLAPLPPKAAQRNSKKAC